MEFSLKIISFLFFSCAFQNEVGLLDYFWRYGYEDFFILNRGDEVINDYTMGWIRTVMYPSNFLYKKSQQEGE